MNVVLASVSREGKVIFELEEEDRLRRRSNIQKNGALLYLRIRPSAPIRDMHEMSYVVFLEIAQEIEKEGLKTFGDNFKLVKFVFYGFSKCIL